ncbi:MAG: YdeI/OmpD-associated family protein [Puniceicoccales bacterium]|jgi:hypothetical protein|nr:YdeI/OmpD-associated family protein [Puniceicoccales bacterium]
MQSEQQTREKHQREYFYPTSSEEWRAWLEENACRRREIWVLFPYKCARRPGISYLEALEEALCFGWIDGIAKRYDEDILSRRFSQRVAKSSWSEVNKQHARILIASGKMAPSGFSTLPDLTVVENPCPDDIIRELQMDSVVWGNFCAFPAYYRNIRIAAIELSRDDPQKFQRMLRYFIEQTRRNRRYGRFQ